MIGLTGGRYVVITDIPFHVKGVKRLFILTEHSGSGMF